MSAFRDLLREGMKHFAEVGYRSDAELADWLARLQMALNREMPNAREAREQLWHAFEAIYRRLVDRKQILKLVPGLTAYTLEQIKPHLRAELDRRVMAGVDLIRLKKAAATQKTLERFSGWVTSIPAGAATDVDIRDAQRDISKSLAQTKFEARRVAIDQGHKLSAAISRTAAQGAGAIAAVWHSHWRQAGYDYRKDHKERDEKVYAIRGNWALEGGFMKAGKAGYLDQITQPAEEPYCRCYATYLVSLGDLPDEMLTAKGQTAVTARVA